MSGKLPLQHLSIRVPWHDDGWQGTICNNPISNAACLVLGRVQETRDDTSEQSYAGCSIQEINEEKWPACIAERGHFMAPFEIQRTVTHAYSKTSKKHMHLEPTELRVPRYSAECIPFRWMLIENAWKIAEELNIPVSPNKEPDIGFPSAWMQSDENQRVLLETFFGAVKPEKSLCFFYVKQTPFTEDRRRILVGVGTVKNIATPIEYKRVNNSGLKSIVWETNVQHSIRPNFEDGFLLPYKQLHKLMEDNPNLNPEEYLAFAPEDKTLEFSYASEHVGHDGAIGALLSITNSLGKLSKLVGGHWDKQLDWLDQKLSDIWKLRGPYPGLGSALSAFGIDHGNLIAYELSTRLEDNENPWSLVNDIINNPEQLPKDLKEKLGNTIKVKWNKLPEKRRDLIKLISRFELTPEQATRFYIEEERKKARIDATDDDILQNPYRIYELDRFSPESVSVLTIDRGMYPDKIVREAHPMPSPSALDGATDSRRVRAHLTKALEEAANSGHTLLPQSQLISSVRDLPVSPSCPIDQDLLSAIDDSLTETITIQKMKDAEKAYQLVELTRMDEIIRKETEKRLNGKRHAINADWRSLLNAELNIHGVQAGDDELEESARQEKTVALQELAEARISILIGPAGTGKTTLLSVLCNHPSIASGEVLLLAPTGKARVKMQQSTKIKAFTIAQFLRQHDRYDENTGRYRVSDRDKYEGARTVIIDEASMLTEEQLGALLDGLKGVHRLILVGDPRQLPPIGPGRPFVDIVTYISEHSTIPPFPRIGKGYVELTIRRRQTGQIREDLQLADWFSGRELGPGEDEIFDAINKNTAMNHLRFITWERPEEIQEKLIEALIERLSVK